VNWRSAAVKLRVWRLVFRVIRRKAQQQAASGLIVVVLRSVQKIRSSQSIVAAGRAGTAVTGTEIGRLQAALNA
jgi:hypothetical protein